MAPYVGTVEIGRLLGVSRQRADQLVRTKEFPDPIARLAMGCVWDVEAVLTWKQTHRPAAGREQDIRPARVASNAV